MGQMTGLECGHLFCRGCWDSYLQVMIMCQGQGQTIECPATACEIVGDEATVLYVIIVFRKVETPSYTRYFFTNLVIS